MNNEEKILAMLTEMKADMTDMKAGMADMKTDMTGMKAGMADMKATQTAQGKQLDRMEERLDEVDARSLRSAVLLETEVAKNIQLVYEGQEMLRQKMEELAPKDRVEALESDVAMMKDVLKLMRLEIAELKKAQ